MSIECWSIPVLDPIEFEFYHYKSALRGLLKPV
jgi:hypothetical protein